MGSWRAEAGQRSTFSFSPPSIRCPVSLALAKLKTVARRPPGLSQYSAESAWTLSSTTLSSSGPWGNQASTALFHSSRFFATSSTTTASPVSDTQLPPEPTPTFTSGEAVMCWTGWESRSAKNQRSPSNSTSCSVMGRLVSRPSMVIVVRKPNRSPFSSSATFCVCSSLMGSHCPQPACRHACRSVRRPVACAQAGDQQVQAVLEGRRERAGEPLVDRGQHGRFVGQCRRPARVELLVRRVGQRLRGRPLGFGLPFGGAADHVGADREQRLLRLPGGHARR